jgi:ketosteroid isomerase-like protein
VLPGEFTDAARMRDGDRLASLFTHDGVLRLPNIPAEFNGREEIRGRSTWSARRPTHGRDAVSASRSETAPPGFAPQPTARPPQG